MRITKRNATFQQWQALLTNRAKRHRAGELLVQGVRPITMAVRHGWTVRALLDDGRRTRSAWAQELLDTVPGQRVTLTPELMHELGQKDEDTPELLAVVAVRPDGLGRLPAPADSAVVVFDRPASPGNVGTLARSVDALGGSALVVAGHAADPWDPQSVRASTGSVFAVPVLRAAGPADVLRWVERERTRGVPVRVLGADEDGEVDVRDTDLTGPVVLVVGSEATGMSSAWRAACDQVVSIPMTGSASSLNAATAGSLLLYERLRQRPRS